MIGLLTAIVLGIPDQPRWSLGAELLLVGVVGAVVVFVLDRRAHREREASTLLRVLEIVTPATTTSVLVTAAGLSLLLGWSGGIYLVVPASVAALVGGVVTAWLVLVRAAG